MGLLSQTSPPPQKAGSLSHITVGSRVIFANVRRHVCAGKAGRARGYYYVGLMIAYLGMYVLR